MRHYVAVTPQYPRPFPPNRSSCHHAEGQVTQWPEWEDPLLELPEDSCSSMLLVWCSSGSVSVSVCVHVYCMLAGRMGVLLITLHALAVSCYSAGPAHGQDRRTMVYTASWIWFRSSVPRSNVDWNHFYQASIASIFSINCWSIIEIYNLSKRALNRIQTSAEASSSPQLDVNVTDNIILGRGQYLHMDSSSLAWWWH